MSVRRAKRFCDLWRETAVFFARTAVKNAHQFNWEMSVVEYGFQAKHSSGVLDEVI